MATYQERKEYATDQISGCLQNDPGVYMAGDSLGATIHEID